MIPQADHHCHSNDRTLKINDMTHPDKTFSDWLEQIKKELGGMTPCSEDIVAMARAAQHDERLSDGDLYRKLADEIERLRNHLEVVPIEELEAAYVRRSRLQTSPVSTSEFRRLLVAVRDSPSLSEQSNAVVVTGELWRRIADALSR